MRGLTTYLMELLERRGEKILTPRPWEEHAAIVNIESPDPPKAAAQLCEKRVIASARNNAFASRRIFTTPKKNLSGQSVCYWERFIFCMNLLYVRRKPGVVDP